jgi:hypothetical protein
MARRPIRSVARGDVGLATDFGPTIGAEGLDGRVSRSGIDEDALELAEIIWRQRLVPPQPDQGDLVLVRLQEHPRLPPGRVRVGADGMPGTATLSPAPT